MINYSTAIKKVKVEESFSSITCYNDPCDGNVFLKFPSGKYTAKELREKKAEHLKMKHDIVARAYGEKKS
ncbi:hypothetical protein LCGC14_0175040 [marine sediment metagenome]|uniref:Uncharacterized protein n=1 Tax=marine sediment metagenome TaxID=412755 RepID=A0A0F9UR65_9ZZZZ